MSKVNYIDVDGRPRQPSKQIEPSRRSSATALAVKRSSETNASLVKRDKRIEPAVKAFSRAVEKATGMKIDEVSFTTVGTKSKLKR